MQALIINGIYECFRGGCIEDMTKGRLCAGNILWKLNPEFFENNKHKMWAQPLFGCIKCMASAYGAITFWPPVLWKFGFHFWEIPVFIADMFILVYLNYFLYKRL